MRKLMAGSIVMIIGACCCSDLGAKEVVLQPKKVATITSPTSVRDSRVLVYFELPKGLGKSGVIIDNAALVFRCQVTDAELGMVEICPVVKDWENAAEVSWTSLWESPGGDFSKTIAGRSSSIKREWGEKQISSNVTFVVRAWLGGILENHGFIILPSQEDLAASTVKYGFDKKGIELKIHYGD
jgi:hypothetical protein